MLTRFPLLLVLAAVAPAGDLLQPGEPQLDRPTLMALGIKLPVSGDDNLNASVAVRYRAGGEESWHDALPLYRLRPETVAGWKVEPQFSGSLFDLRPATPYEIELHVVDPDGLDSTLSLSATTRAVPDPPAAPKERSVTDAAALAAAVSTVSAFGTRRQRPHNDGPVAALSSFVVGEPEGPA